MLALTRDFGRVDFRLGEDGKVYFLEVNAFPSLDPSTPLPMAAALAGVNVLDGVLDAIVKSAAERQGLTQHDLLQLLEANPPHEEKLLAEFEQRSGDGPLYSSILYILTHLSFVECGA